jgi:hypothetical protein
MRGHPQELINAPLTGENVGDELGKHEMRHSRNYLTISPIPNGFPGYGIDISTDGNRVGKHEMTDSHCL